MVWADGDYYILAEAEGYETYDSRAEGRTVPVHLHSRVTEVGTLELWFISRDGKQRWKLEFNVRESHK